jgi:hypothetical protein
MSLAEQIARSFDRNAKKSREGYICKCPCHEDSKPSLSVTETAEGRILMNCKSNAGCSWDLLLKAAQANGFLLPKKSNGKAYDRYENAVFYTFKDASGNPIARTVKKPKTDKRDKISWIEGFDDNRWVPTLSPKGKEKIEVPLYNLRSVLDSDIVYLCEGEKDAETLIEAGFCGTTNQAGAKYWAKRLSLPLTNKTVVICQDNDLAGKERTKTLIKALQPIVKELRLFEPPNVPEKGDITDWVEAGGKCEDVFGLSYIISKSVAEKKKDPATRSDYIQIIQEFFDGVKRDIFSEDLCYRDKYSGFWQPAANKLKALRSEVKELSLSFERTLSASEVEDHFYHLENFMQPGFMVDIPEWDGRDRIAELAQRITIKDTQKAYGIDEAVFEQFLKYWHAKMWLRLFDPSVRNEIFILAGEQNIGKDFWIRENLEALGQYLINFSIHSQEKDTKEQLHQGLVMNISEFDRTSKAEASLLKEIVTATQTNVRFAYDRRSAPRKCYCSFIASTNVKDIFNDPTGHSRYAFFELETIDKSTRFNEDDKLQVLAQGQYLANQAYEPNPEYLERMRLQIAELTPDSEQEIVVETWDMLCSDFFKELSIEVRQDLARINSHGKFSAFMPNKLFVSAFEKINKRHGKSEKWIRTTLSHAGRRRVDPALGRGFYFNLLGENSALILEGLSGNFDQKTLDYEDDLSF